MPQSTSVVFIHPRSNVITPVCSPDKKKSNAGHSFADVITNFQSDCFPQLQPLILTPRHSLQSAPLGQHVIILDISFSPVHAGASARIEDPRLSDPDPGSLRSSHSDPTATCRAHTCGVY